MILIVDSEKISDAAIKHSFHELGFQTVEVVKTAEAAKTFINNNKHISMIVINEKLDDSDGCSLCLDIKKEISSCQAYIFLIVSSVQNKTAIEKSRHCGANNFAVKPYSELAFREKIAQFALSRVVVLVEDDPVVSMTVINILARYSIEVISINDGIAAYNLFKSMSPVRLVLMDIGLPNMSGLQLVKAIRSKSAWRKTAVVMLTGSTDVADVKASLTSGANDYIAKPFKIDSFVSKIDKYFLHES